MHNTTKWEVVFLHKHQSPCVQENVQEMFWRGGVEERPDSQHFDLLHRYYTQPHRRISRIRIRVRKCANIAANSLEHLLPVCKWASVRGGDSYCFILLSDELFFAFSLLLAITNLFSHMQVLMITKRASCTILNVAISAKQQFPHFCILSCHLCTLDRCSPVALSSQ